MERLSFLRWVILTGIAILFSMASITEETMLRYPYLIVAIGACYIIKGKGGESNPKGRR